MGAWIDERQPDILALQEVRASTADLTALYDAGWHVCHDEATAKGRAGVAVLSTMTPIAHRTALGPEGQDTAGRWLETDFVAGGEPLTVVSAYVHSGEAGTAKQEAKFQFLDVFEARMHALAAMGTRVLVVGDLNIGHGTLDIKNWKGNLTHAGFLPGERAVLNRLIGPAPAPPPGATEAADKADKAPGWVDVGRQFSGAVPGPYTWWSWRGQAFDNDAGWRIDYHLATPSLAATATTYAVDRAPNYAARWSDHAPVVVHYAL